MSENLLDENRVKRGIKNTALGTDLWKERKAAAEIAEKYGTTQADVAKKVLLGEVCREEYSGRKEPVQGEEEEDVCLGLLVLLLHFYRGFHQPRGRFRHTQRIL